MYLMACTRPDLAYPLSLLARYVAPSRHRKVHWDAAKRVLHYLCSTSGMGLVLGRQGLVVLTGHAVSSWVDDSATQRSSQGYTFSLDSGSVLWRSTPLSSVLSSTCEAEIYAGAMAAQELRWLTYLLIDLGEQPRSPPLGQLRLAYVATRANTADIFTKALPPGDHQRFSTMLGLPDAPRTSYTNNFRHVIGNMAIRVHRRIQRTNRRQLCHVSPPPPGREVEFSTYNNPFTQDGDFVSDECEQDWDMPTPLVESPSHDDDFINSPSIDSYFIGHYIDTRPVDNYRWTGDKRTPFRNTPNLAFSAQTRTDTYSTWYLDRCCEKHMAGFKHFISNACPIPQPTAVTVANSQQLKARACSIVVLKAQDSDIHITLNDVLIVRDLKYNLLSYEQLVHNGVLMSTDTESQCIPMHWKDYSKSDSEPRYIGKACPDNGVYILDFDIPNCRTDSGDLIDLQP
ncbi:unnamed protein product [Closterium sp. NIES-53]